MENLLKYAFLNLVLFLSFQNFKGTEGNGKCDWVDEDGNGVWTEGIDAGEEWRDVGIDGCADDMESGDGRCGGNDDGVSDPNGDNYNIDPNEDITWSDYTFPIDEFRKIRPIFLRNNLPLLPALPPET